mgnify:CR=1 FL=1
MAAGKGTRMKSARPKVLHRLAGMSLLQHVLNTCVPLRANRSIVITGHGDRDLARQAFDLGACAFFNKPLDTEALEKEVKKIEGALKSAT